MNDNDYDRHADGGIAIAMMMMVMMKCTQCAKNNRRLETGWNIVCETLFLEFVGGRFEGYIEEDEKLIYLAYGHNITDLKQILTMR